jgi:hypothetical protein
LESVESPYFFYHNNKQQQYHLVFSTTSYEAVICRCRSPWYRRRGLSWRLCRGESVMFMFAVRVVFDTFLAPLPSERTLRMMNDDAMRCLMACIS